MTILRFFILSILFTCSYAIVEQKYNETELLQQLFDLPFPTIEIPDLLNPDNKDPSIQNRIPQRKLINIGLPTLPNLLPTAFPIKIPTIKIPDLIPTALPTIKIPDIIPKNLPTIPPLKIPTVKLPTLPHILPTALPKLPTIKLPTLPHLLPTALPTLFPPKPKGPTQTNIVCDICEYAVDQLKIKFMALETTARNTLTNVLGIVCDKLSKMFPSLIIIDSTCNLVKINVINKIFEKLDSVKKLNEKTVCAHLPFCKYK